MMPLGCFDAITLEEVAVGRAVWMCGPFGGVDLAAVASLLCGVTVAEGLQLGVETVGRHRPTPSRRRSRWGAPCCDEATVEVGGGATGGLQRAQRIEESVEKFSTSDAGRVASHDLGPGGVVDARREVPMLIELRYHNTTISFGWDGIALAPRPRNDPFDQRRQVADRSESLPRYSRKPWKSRAFVLQVAKAGLDLSRDFVPKRSRRQLASPMGRADTPVDLVRLRAQWEEIIRRAADHGAHNVRVSGPRQGTRLLRRATSTCSSKWRRDAASWISWVCGRTSRSCSASASMCSAIAV